MNTPVQKRKVNGFSFVEAIFTIAIIGIMSALVVAAISNVSRDANRVMARQQQASVQSALTAWVMAQMRVNGTQQFRSLESVRTTYNAVASSQDRFKLLAPNLTSADPTARVGYLDQTTADHFTDYTTSADKLQTASLVNAAQYLTMPDWQSGDFPHVDLVNL